MTAYQDFLARKLRTAPPCGFEPATLPDALFPFQAAIVRWACVRGRAAIFADCGMGKTLMQLSWAAQVPGDVLILTPLAVAEQTLAEAARFGIGARIAQDQAGCGAGINITNYEKLHRFDLGAFAGLVLDESSILKNYTGKVRTEIINGAQAIPYRLACTATPAPNDYVELGNHSEFVSAMTRSEMLSMFFCHDGGSTQDWRLKGHARRDFWRWVCSWAVMLRKPSDLGFSDEGFDLPPLEWREHLVECDAYASDALFDFESPSMIDRRRIRKGSIEARVAKAAALVAAEPDEPWILWCDLNDESSALADAIPGAVEVSGSDTNEHKTRALLGFARGEIKRLVTKPSIAGHGMNWQTCARMAFVGLSDSYEQLYQASRRCWRFGQKRPVQVHIITAEGEGAVLHNVRRKESDAMAMGEEMAREAQVFSDVRGDERPRPRASHVVEAGAAWRIVHADCVDVVSGLEPDSVDYAVFSPPFASLYTYSDSERDMGNCGDTEQFMEHFRYLVDGLFRAHRPGRLLSFHCMNLPTSKARDGYIGIRDFRGDLIRAFTEAGWIYHSEVVIWKDPVTAMQRTKALGLLHKQLKKDACMSRQGIPDYVVTMRKPGENTRPVENTNETFPVAEWQQYASPVWMDINPSDTLQKESAREEEDERHICPLQLDVTRRCLRLWSRPDDLVLSPFAGIGSEGYVAVQEGRRFLGVELKESYFKQACANLRAAELLSKQGALFA